MHKQMKIAILISSLRFGGAEKQAVVDAELLVKRHQVLFIAFEGGKLREQLPDEVEYIEFKKTNYISTGRGLAKLFKQKKVDVVHAHLFAPMLISGIATLFCKTIAVWNFHSHAYQDAQKGRLAHSTISKFPGVKSILFPANELKDYYKSESFTFPAKKEIIFFNSGQFWEQQEFEEDAPSAPVIIGFIGRIIPLKRVHLLVQLARELKDEGVNNVKMSIVGDGKSLPDVKALAKEKDVEDMMDFHGFQTNTYKYYKEFSIFTLPSEEEVLSLSLIDAQLIGLPCVAFDVGGNADVVENGQSGFIVNDESEFMIRFKELIKDRDLRKKMGLRAIEQSTDKFSQKARLENLEQLYKSGLKA